MAQLQAWNPSLQDDCGNLILGDAYCVSGSNATSSATPTSSAPGPVATPPGPTQSGIASDCNKYVLQQDGVYCADMATAAGITLTQLYTWNPALNGDCSGLWKGYAYCVGVS